MTVGFGFTPISRNRGETATPNQVVGYLENVLNVFSPLATYVAVSSWDYGSPATTVETTEERISRVTREMGRRGGYKGGTIRAQRMPEAQRSAAASLAAKARWKKEDAGNQGTATA